MSKAKQKGTVGENEILNLLIDAGFWDAHRTEASRESHDIWAEPFVVEVKYRKVWSLFEWIPKLRRVAEGKPWVLFAIHGDRRTGKGKEVGRVAVLDADFAVDLMSHYRDTIRGRGPFDDYIGCADGTVASMDDMGKQDSD